LNGTCRPEGRKPWNGFRNRVFDIDIEHCPHCGGELKIITAIQEPRVVARILDHLGLPTSPLRSRAVIQTIRNSLILHRYHDSIRLTFGAGDPLWPSSIRNPKNRRNHYSSALLKLQKYQFFIRERHICNLQVLQYISN